MVAQPYDQNNSVQTVKPTTIFSPGEAINRRNDSLIIQKQASQKTMVADKQSPTVRQKQGLNYDKSQGEVQIGKGASNDLYANMKAQLQKQRSLQSLYNTTQKLATAPVTQRPQQQPQSSRNFKNNAQSFNGIDSSRPMVRRGSKNTLGSQGALNQTGILEVSLKGQVNNQFFMFKNNLSSMTRNKSAYLNFNSTQPISSQNRTELELKADVAQYTKGKMIHNQSPSVSSDEDKDEQVSAFRMERVKSIPREEGPVKLPPSHQKKKSQLPNGSFIETKMKNCLHARNVEQQTQGYQTYQGGSNIKQALSKNMSQPLLHQAKITNLTQRTTFVKTSFLRHEETRSVTPINGQSTKSPIGQSTLNDKASTKSKTKQIQGLKGDLKSLNLSPIIPQNLGKNQPQFQKEQSASQGDISRTNLASTKKRLEMRKQSVKSNQNAPLNTSKPYNSLRKDSNQKQIQSKKNLKDEPTTEKKVTNKSPSNNVRPMGYGSQDTERAPGATHSYSTNDEFNLISQNTNQYLLRLKKEPSQPSRNLIPQHDQFKHFKTSNHQFTEMANLNDETVMKSQIPGQTTTILNKAQESKIKLTQILSNNKLIANQDRYNFNLTPDQMISAQPDHGQANKTPKALPYGNDDTFIFQEEVKFNTVARANKEEEKTQKKPQRPSKIKHCDSFDEEEDMPDAKDFEEFDVAEQSSHSGNSLKVRVQIVEQEQVFINLRNQKQIQAQPNTAIPEAEQSQYPKDDRNSLVNYDTSLLTHNTGRDMNSSPISDLHEIMLRKSKKLATNVHEYNVQPRGGQQYNQRQRDDTFVLAAGVRYQEQDQGMDVQYTKTDDQYYEQDGFQHTQEEFDDEDQYNACDTEQAAVTQRKSQQHSQYHTIMQQLQVQEESEIEHLTQNMIQSLQYKQLKSDKERAKYLAQKISQVRSKYKELLIDNLLGSQ